MPDEKLAPNQAPQNLPTIPTSDSKPVTPPEPSKPLGEPEDILDEVDKAEPAVERPTTLTPDSAGPVPPAVAAPEKAVAKEPIVKQHKKAFAAILTVLVIGGILALAGWYGYNVFLAPQPALPQVTGISDQVSPQTNQSSNINQAPVDANVDISPQSSRVVDTDRDGITDQEEELYGTDPTAVDTDQDGLTDRDEIKVFNTDPNNPDTDGDGFLDGEEVRSGYDPKGPGRLLKIE